MGIFPSDDLLTWAEHRPTSVAGPSLEEVVVGCQVFHPQGRRHAKGHLIMDFAGRLPTRTSVHTYIYGDYNYRNKNE